MSKKIKVGIWGLGRAGIRMHVPEIKGYPNLFEVVAGYDTDASRREAMRQECPCRIYSEEKAFLSDPEIELISIATRSTEHVEHALKALATGKYVFLEKPIGLNYAEALKLLEADKQYPGKLFLRHNRRFEAPFTHICEIIDSGILGDIYEVKLRRHNYQRRDDWQTIIDCGGGQLNNWGAHIIDHALRFLNSPIKETWSDLKRIAAAGDAEDHLKIILKGENNCVVDLEISGGMALPEPEYIIHGTKGALICKDMDIHIKYVNPKQKLAPIAAKPGNPPLDGGVASGYADLQKIDWIEKHMPVALKAGCDTRSIWRHIHDSICKNEPFPITMEQAVEVVRISELVKEKTPFCMKKD